MFSEFDCLIGKKLIEPATLSDDKSTITIKTETSTITLYADGDCCSTSWVEHFDGIPAGETINKIIEKEVERIESDDFDCLLKYFYEIVTDKGSHTIEMRNENNGYYGGYFEVNETLKESEK